MAEGQQTEQASISQRTPVPHSAKQGKGLLKPKLLSYPRPNSRCSTDRTRQQSMFNRCVQVKLNVGFYLRLLFCARLVHPPLYVLETLTGFTLALISILLIKKFYVSLLSLRKCDYSPPPPKLSRVDH